MKRARRRRRFDQVSEASPGVAKVRGPGQRHMAGAGEGGQTRQRSTSGPGEGGQTRQRSASGAGEGSQTCQRSLSRLRKARGPGQRHMAGPGERHWTRQKHIARSVRGSAPRRRWSEDPRKRFCAAQKRILGGALRDAEGDPMVSGRRSARRRTRSGAGAAARRSLRASAGDARAGRAHCQPEGNIVMTRSPIVHRTGTT
jgi:hypothetical protein